MMSKITLREDARLRRASLRFALPGFAQTIAKFAGDLPVAGNAIIAGYWPVRDEADPRALMAALAARGHGLALPCVENGRPLVFRRWREGDVTIPNFFQIEEPHTSQTAVDPGVVLVPLLAFDSSGHRLGYGGGYYDRTLERRRKNVLVIGIAYAGQEVPALPREAHDHRLDAVLTEKGFRRFANPQ